MKPTGPDPQLVKPGIAFDMERAGARFLRLRAAIRYPEENVGTPRIAELFWRYQDADFSGEQLKEIPLRQDGKIGVLWAILSTDQIKGPITGIRFDPINSQTPVEIQWIAIDLVQ